MCIPRVPPGGTQRKEIDKKKILKNPLVRTMISNIAEPCGWNFQDLSSTRTRVSSQRSFVKKLKDKKIDSFSWDAAALDGASTNQGTKNQNIASWLSNAFGTSLWVHCGTSVRYSVQIKGYSLF